MRARSGKQALRPGLLARLAAGKSVPVDRLRHRLAYGCGEGGDSPEPLLAVPSLLETPPPTGLRAARHRTQKQIRPGHGAAILKMERPGLTGL